jgi:Protein of unknown function (DUF429)
MLVLGIDFTSSPRRAKPITVARGRVSEQAFQLEAIDSLPDWAAFEALLAAPGPWIGGFDFPFGLPREAVGDLRWPMQWPALVRHCAALGRERFRAALDRYRESRPIGARYAHRATDLPARSHSPLKFVNPPVALMFLEGAPRLLAADVSAPGLHAGDPLRIALEAYPGLAARAMTRDSYKSDDRAKQTSARHATRKLIIERLVRDGGPFGADALPASSSRISTSCFTLKADCGMLESLEADASGDRLDAVLAAMQAAWASRRSDARYGLPHNIDPLEGWIVMAPHS